MTDTSHTPPGPLSDTTPAPVAAPSGKPKKSGCGCMLPLVILGLLIGFAPRIISHTILRNQVPALLIKELPPGVKIGSAEVGWSTPIALNDVVIPDDQGKPALKAQHVTLSISLWELVRGVGNYGTIVIEDPTLDLCVEGGVTNYERFLARLSLGTPRGAPLPQFDVQLQNGTIVLRSERLTADPIPDAERPAPVAVIQIPKANLTSSTAAEHNLIGQLVALLNQPEIEQPIRADLTWDLPRAGGSGIGNGRLNIDVPSLPLEVLAPWIEPYTSGRMVSGELGVQATMDVVPSPEGRLLLGANITLPRLDFRLSGLSGANGSITPPYRWQGENLQLIAEGAGDLGGKLVTFEQCRLRTPIANADFHGTVADLPGRVICDLTGTSDVEVQELLSFIPSKQSQNIQFEGLQLGEIRIQGPLRNLDRTRAPDPLLVSTDLQWVAANFYGFRSTNALVTLNYADDALEINPHHLPIGRGQWIAAPRIEFGHSTAELIFAGGPVLKEIEFTPEMSQSWMRYVSPLLGSSTRLEGQFSLSAEPARIQLTAPYRGQFQGLLEIESAQAGPGPMVLQVLQSVSALQAMLGRKPGTLNQQITVARQSVPFEYAQGRVSHHNLRIGMGDVTLISSGSVGMDETIEFQIDMPLPDRWTENRPLLAGLKGESIPFRMSGTLDQPQLDGRALAEMGQRMGTKGAAGLIDGLLQRRQEKVEDGSIRPAPRRMR